MHIFEPISDERGQGPEDTKEKNLEVENMQETVTEDKIESNSKAKKRLFVTEMTQDEVKKAKTGASTSDNNSEDYTTIKGMILELLWPWGATPVSPQLNPLNFPNSDPLNLPLSSPALASIKAVVPVPLVPDVTAVGVPQLAPDVAPVPLLVSEVPPPLPPKPSSRSRAEPVLASSSSVSGQPMNETDVVLGSSTPDISNDDASGSCFDPKSDDADTSDWDDIKRDVCKQIAEE